MLAQRLYELARFNDELNQLRGLMNQNTSAGVFPLINVTEDTNKYYIRAELPGVKVEDIEIMATGNSLAISGERKIASEGENVKYHRREREAGKFSRMLNLPNQIDSSKVEAKLINGILTISLPFAEKSKPRQIVIK